MVTHPFMVKGWRNVCGKNTLFQIAFYGHLKKFSVKRNNFPIYEGKSMNSSYTWEKSSKNFFGGTK